MTREYTPSIQVGEMGTTAPAKATTTSTILTRNVDCNIVSMTIGQKVTRWGGMRLSRRLRRSIPILGTVIAVATVVSTVRRKGVVSGTLDTGLNAVPILGVLKNVAEVVRGRDFFPDRYPPAAKLRVRG